jgi:hypothetical protein
MPNKPEENKEEPISRGSVVGQIASLILNPAKDKLKEFTYINRYQASLFPLLDTIIIGRQYVLEVQAYLMSKEEYRKAAKKVHKSIIPEMPDLASVMLYSTAQWQKSIGGKNFEKGIELALAETEKEKDGLSGIKGVDNWEND